MTLSIWRYSHLVLAISSSFFLLLIALTGLVLSFEPIQNSTYPYKISGAEKLTLSKILQTVTARYEESIYSLEKDKNDFLLLETESAQFYINPFTGENLGKPLKRKQLFKTMEGLHRSLLLQTPGRIFVGLNAFLCFLVVFSGVMLIAKRQQGFKNFFKRVSKDYLSQYLHTVFGRWLLLPLLVLSLTGTYLFLQRFEIIPKPKVTLVAPEISTLHIPLKKQTTFPIFKNTTLDDLRKITFPFDTEDPEEYFHLQLKRGEYFINQFTGAIIASQKYPFTLVLQALSLKLHTGAGNPIWAIILGLSTLAIPYFIYSGFVITFKRRKGRIKNRYKKDQCECIILVGSEGGTTFTFAKMLQNALFRQGKKCFTTELNNYTTFAKMQHLIIMTATYGVGQPPSNARKFLPLLKQNDPNKNYTYAVLGFGSLAYPDFCQYAIDINNLLCKKYPSKKMFNLHTVNNQSFESFTAFVNEWSAVLNVPLKIEPTHLKIKRPKTFSYGVSKKTNASDAPDDTYLMYLTPPKKQRILSGDLLAVYPPDENRARLYSIAMVDDKILLSVKRHLQGVCSNYMNDLKTNETLTASLQKNKAFYVPRNKKPVICIATGTGIAPFLGMLRENETLKKPMYLYWGGRDEHCFELYQPLVHRALEKNALMQYMPAYSRQGAKKIYVQHLIKRDMPAIAITLQQGGTVMICGAIAMQQAVFEILQQATIQYNKKPMSYYQKKGQIRVDCY